ncbi:hypothetical protein SISSUDRAFT_1052030 [Sistotremastrum suecicum HHB10207 ss-3]|uniref:Uncharacterized protein n=1 Tax=Sistotremastrum suecicum HHB10207 ss-3 TaxID=1314776 RepID=A0A166A6S8_9AGAM|nr:hypothetical protein SISSUDRAFT_1052030 [Sistotremastrum suecicum HHB10207 ss-3]
MGWRMSCSLERWEALRHVFLREGYRMNETGEVAEWYQKKIRWRMSSHWVEILPDGQMKSFAKQIIFPQNAAGITQILSNPAILRQSIYREACYTPGPLQDLLYSLMICAPGLLSLCFRMESPFPDREIDLVIFLPPQPWVRANERWVRYILGRRPYQNLCELPWSERYVLRERFD